MLENTFTEKLRKCFFENGLSRYLNEKSEEKLYNLFEILVEYNKNVNLTAITDEKGVILKHFADSITIAKHIPANSRLLDVGCGGGFPSLPVAIVRDDVEILGIDSVTKKITFVNYAAQKLQLKNISAESVRAEELAKNAKYRESFDAVCARAVSRLNIISELCIPFLKNSGIFLSMKADDFELTDAQNALKMLNSSVAFTDKFTLSSFDGEILSRCIIGIVKNGKTPEKYPRNYSAITKSPL